MLKLKINPVVAEDLKAIRDYIAEDNEKHAAKTIKEIYGKFENLQMFPDIGSDLSKRVSFKTDYKYAVWKDYVVLDVYKRQVRPLNFLIKPVQEQDIIKNLEKAIKLSQYYDDYIKFQRGSELYSVAYGEVRYFSTTGRKVEIHTTSVDLDFYGKLDDVQAKTPPGFIRIHKSYLIHEMYVKKWEYEMVVMNRDEQLSISPRYRKAVREMLMKRWREE